MDHKTCFKCKEEKPLSGFYKHKMMADGRLNKCKECTKKEVREHRANNDSVREYDRRRYQDPDRQARTRENTTRWRKANPEKYKAQTKVGNAIRDGKLEKKTECEKCGSDFHVHAHHSDYSKPLDIEWLCARCHHIHHAEC